MGKATSGGNVIDLFTGRHIEPETATTEYAEAMARHIIPAYGEMGLDTPYMAMLTRHIKDLRLAINPRFDKTPSRLTVVKDEKTGQFVRVATMNEADLQKRTDALTAVVPKHSSSDELEESAAKRLGLDWLFYELSADALANVYYLQRKVGKYIPDFDGQSNYYESQYSISSDFLAEYAEGGYNHSTVSADHASFRRGIAMRLLERSLLEQGAAETHATARAITWELASDYPKDALEEARIAPMTEAGLVSRFVFMEPVNTRAEFAKFVLANYGPAE